MIWVFLMPALGHELREACKPRRPPLASSRGTHSPEHEVFCEIHKCDRHDARVVPCVAVRNAQHGSNIRSAALKVFPVWRAHLAPSVVNLP